MTHATVVATKFGGVHTEKPEKPVAFDCAINFLANAPKFGFHIATVYFVDGSELIFGGRGFEREKDVEESPAALRAQGQLGRDADTGNER